MSLKPSAMAIDMLERATGTDVLEQYAPEIESALLIRLVEERLLRLFSEGRLFGTVHTCIGQEFVGIAMARALRSQDAIFFNHRCHGHFLGYRRDLRRLIGEVLGKSTGVRGGRGGSQHLQLENFFSNGQAWCRSSPVCVRPETTWRRRDHRRLCRRRDDGRGCCLRSLESRLEMATARLVRLRKQLLRPVHGTRADAGWLHHRARKRSGSRRRTAIPGGGRTCSSTWPAASMPCVRRAGRDSILSILIA